MLAFCPKIDAKSTISQKCDMAKTVDFIRFFEGRFYDETVISCDTQKEGQKV